MAVSAGCMLKTYPQSAVSFHSEDATPECEGAAEALTELAKRAERGCDVCNINM